MRELRVVAESNPHGVAADLRFRAHTGCLEEGRAPMIRDRRTLMDTTRFTQFGAWEGWIEADGRRVADHAAGGARRRATAPGASARSASRWAGGRRASRSSSSSGRRSSSATRLHARRHLRRRRTASRRQLRVEHPRPPLDGRAARRARTRRAERFLGVRHAHRVEARHALGARRRARAGARERRARAHPARARARASRCAASATSTPSGATASGRATLALGGESWKTDELNPLAPQHLHVQQVVRADVGRAPRASACSSRSCSAPTRATASAAPRRGARVSRRGDTLRESFPGRRIPECPPSPSGTTPSPPTCAASTPASTSRRCRRWSASRAW